MTGKQFEPVQIRVMSDDPEAVERAVELLGKALGGAVSFTGSARNRQGDGKRAYGTLLLRALAVMVEDKE